MREGNEGEAEVAGLLAKVVFTALLIAGFVAGEDGVIVRGAGFEKMIDDAGEFVSGGGDGLGGAEAGAHAPEVIAEGGVAFAGAVGGHAQSVSGAALDGASMRREDASAGDAMIRAESKPRRKMFCGGKLRQVAADLRKKRMYVDGAQTGQRGEVDAEEAVQMTTQIELRLITLRLFALTTEGSRCGLARLALHRAQVALDRAVAIHDLRLINPIERQGLLQREQMFRAV